MNITPVHNDDDYQETMARIDVLMDLNGGEGPEMGTPEADELEIRAVLAERYEEEAFPLDLPSPVDAVKFALEQRGLVQSDLSRILRSRSRASELLSGNLNGLSRRMMQGLHKHLHIPAEILIRDMDGESSR